jgi:hypothetical protein
MCGIFGTILATNHISFKNALDTLEHRDPDLQDFINCELIDDNKRLKSDILDIIMKKNNDHASAENAWTDLTPYLWKKAVFKRNFKND